MQTCLQFKDISLKSNPVTNNNLSSQAINLVKRHELEPEFYFLDNIKQTKVKIIKQLPNIYKNTRLAKYLIQNHSSPYITEYRKIRGLVRNIQKRFAWYTDLKEEDLNVLLLSVKSKSAIQDLGKKDQLKYFFIHYCKIIFDYEDQKHFIAIPLVDLNIIVI